MVQSLIQTLHQQEQAPVRLILFPHAGAASTMYQKWIEQEQRFQKLHDQVEIATIQLRTPTHHPVPSMTSMSNLVEAILNELVAFLDKPMIFYAHSAGALIATALTYEMTARGLPTPLRMIISGCKPPSPEDCMDEDVLNDRSKMIELMRSWGGTDAALFEHDEFMQLAAELLRSDLLVSNSFLQACSPEAMTTTELLGCKMAVFGGQDDEFVPPEALAEWRALLNPECDFQIEILPGGHFFHTGESDFRFFKAMTEIILSDIAVQTISDLERIEQWNNQVMEYSQDLCLHDMFIESAKRTPDAPAVIYGDQQLTFRELDQLTDELAEYLYVKGVRPDSIVGIYMEHCTEFVVAYIAALKAGGAYMPLEIVYPAELLARILEEATPVILLTKTPHSSRLPAWQAKLEMNDDGLWKSQLQINHDNIDLFKHKPGPDNLGFVVMSSGTTGVPKGICNPHRAAVHSYYWRLQEYPFQPDDRVACHVFFIWELLRPLLGNIPLYVIPDEIIFDPVNLLEYLDTHRITRILFTPSLLQLILDTVSAEELVARLKHMRIIWLCGEVVTIELRNRFVRLLPECKLLNLYSVSECHDVSACDLNTVDIKLSPKYASCGPVMPNVRCYIMSEDMQQVPVGVPGELYVAGPCLSRYYLKRPEQTAARFFDFKIAPTDSKPTRLYKTGDRARFLPNGHLELIGRCDFMVKIRGYSIVLGAVEAALSEHPKISTAVVLAEGEEGSDKRLVAYVVPEEWDQLPSTRSVQTFLKDHIPHYAIPSIFVSIDVLPINDASGKLDRKRLPPIDEAKLLRAHSLDAADSMDAFSVDVEMPETQVEMQLANIWADLLGLRVETLHLGSNFFDIGGHSLLAARLASAIREQFDLKITLSDILHNSDLKAMSNRIDSLVEIASTGCSSIGEDRVGHSIIDLPTEAMLDPLIYPAPTRKTGYSRYRVEMAARPPRNVLVTGVTGFLGVHILSSILENTHAAVYCLVRAPNEEAALDRVVDQLKKFKLWETVHENHGIDRIIPITGDLSKPLFGLDSHAWKCLAGEIDAIIHNGAAVNLVQPYESLKPVNVLGTQEVLRLAVTNGLNRTNIKPVHYVSTNGVFPFSSDFLDEAEAVVMREESVEHLWQDLEDGYAQSKWVAEQMCTEAANRGLPVSILRPGNMAPSSVTGQWNPTDFIYLLLEGCRRLQLVPNDATWNFDMTPVNFAADAICYLSVQQPKKSLGQTLHIQTHRSPVPAAKFFKDFIASCKDLTIKQVSFTEWKQALFTLVDKEPVETSKALHQLAAGLESFDYYLSTSALFDATQATAILHHAKLEAPEVDARYLHTLVYTQS